LQHQFLALIMERQRGLGSYEKHRLTGGVQFYTYNPNPDNKSQPWAMPQQWPIDAVKLLAGLQSILILGHFFHCIVYAKCPGDLQPKGQQLLLVKVAEPWQLSPSLRQLILAPKDSLGAQRQPRTSPTKTLDRLARRGTRHDNATRTQFDLPAA
jgi:hypothetical protein